MPSRTNQKMNGIFLEIIIVQLIVCYVFLVLVFWYFGSSYWVHRVTLKKKNVRLQSSKAFECLC